MTTMGDCFQVLNWLVNSFCCSRQLVNSVWVIQFSPWGRQWGGAWLVASSCWDGSHDRDYCCGVPMMVLSGNLHWNHCCYWHYLPGLSRESGLAYSESSRMTRTAWDPPVGLPSWWLTHLLGRHCSSHIGHTVGVSASQRPPCVSDC